MNTGWTLPEKAFLWIEENIPHGSKIIELGSGYGSSRLAENYQLWSIEHDEKWLNKCSSTYIHAEIIPFSVNGIEGFWYNPEKIKKFIPKDYSLLIIDGPPSTIGRNGILVYQDIFDWNCFVLIDDTHRLEDKDIADQLSLHKSLNQIHFTEYYEKTNVNRKFTILVPE